MIGLLKKLFSGWRKRESAIRPTILSLGYRRDTQLASEAAYKKVALVYRCIRARATNIQQVPVYGVKVVGGKGKGRVERLPDKHPFAQLLARPNEEDDFSALLEASVTHQDLRGEMLWELDSGKSGEKLLPPARIYPVPPQWIERVDFDWAARKYTNFQIVVGGSSFPLAADNAVFFKFYNPDNPIRGLAPMCAAYDAADLSHSASLFNRKFFDNGGAVSLVYGFDKDAPVGELTPAIRARMTEELSKMNSGPDGWHSIMITGPGEKISDPAAGGRRDMDFVRLLDRTDGEIRCVFGVPPILCANVEDANRANSLEQRAMFWEETLIPYARDYESLINHKIARRFGPDIRCVFDFTQVSALRKDLQKLSAALVPLVGGNILTVNEAREDLGKPPVEWGDDPADPSKNTPPSEPPMAEPGTQGAGLLTPEAAQRMVRGWMNAALSRIHEGAKTPMEAFPPAREARKAARKFGVPFTTAWQLARQVQIEMALRWNQDDPAESVESLFEQYGRSIEEIMKGEEKGTE